MTPSEKSYMIAYANERINDLVEEMNKQLARGVIASYTSGFIYPSYYLYEVPSRRTIETFVTRWYQKYPKVNPYMQKWGNEMRTIFFDTIQKGAENGLHPYQVAQEIKKREELYWVKEGRLKGYQAKRIARSEMMRAYNAATLHRYKYSGLTTKTWSTYAPCPQCAMLEGEEVGIDETFSCGLHAPPLHPNCMCVIIPGKEVYDNIISKAAGVAA